jgi:putative Ca2+/H+ antiporter (TMEM165/GDT1 family)
MRQKNSEKEKEDQKYGWRPGYLQRRVLIAFIVVFCAVIAALEVLNYISQVNYRIASSVNSRHYAWTYGPTAILTVIAALWSRVEFQAKQYAPWQAMQEGPTEASQSVLLDYLSPMQPVALFKAFRNRNLVVFSSISCSLFLSLALVLSTGLFALREDQIQRNGVEIQLLDTFLSGDIWTLTEGDQSDIFNYLTRSFSKMEPIPTARPRTSLFNDSQHQTCLQMQL